MQNAFLGPELRPLVGSFAIATSVPLSLVVAFVNRRCVVAIVEWWRYREPMWLRLVVGLVVNAIAIPILLTAASNLK